MFGISSMATVGDPFKNKLLKLKTISNGIEIQFKKDETEIAYIQ